jgi:hypothetical protein
VCRRVGREAPASLLELALAADPVAAARLIPGDRDVHEALVEVALLRLGGAPRRLELLMGLEVFAAADQVDAALIGSGHAESFAPSRVRVTLTPMATILLCGVDLFIRGKLEGALADHRLITTDGIDPPDLVIADVARLDPTDVADAYPEVPLLGFTNHTDTAGLRAAHAAGFDQVVAKSALFERTRELIDGLLAPVE